MDTVSSTQSHQLCETVSASTYVWSPPANATDSYTAVNNLNQYPSWTPSGSALKTFGYDGNGNLTSATLVGIGWSYSYDPENKLVKASKTSGGVIASYAYDPLGRRNAKSGTGVTATYFVSDGTDEIAEYTGAGALSLRYVPGSTINQPIASVSSTGTRKFLQYDRHGSVIAVANNGGTEIEGPYTYDTFGSGAPTTGVAYKYVGMRLDPETGLYFDRARYYSSILGRFFQPDPVGYTADLNLYPYTGNDPINKMDPSGKVTTCVGIGENAHCTMTADTYDPSSSNHVTAVPSSETKAAVEAGKDTLASFGKEKVGYVVPDDTGKPVLRQDTNAKTGNSLTGNTAKSAVPPNALAVAHGHDELAPSALKGMVDSTKDANGYGDTASLALNKPIPTATIFRGDVGWHQMKDGRLEFTFRAGAMTSGQANNMQKNLNTEQSLFQTQ